MDKLKQLWQYPLFRLVCLYLLGLFVLYLCAVALVLVAGQRWVQIDLMRGVFGSEDALFAFVFLFPFLAAVIWVWRRLFGRMILRLVRVVNKAAEWATLDVDFLCCAIRSRFHRPRKRGDVMIEKPPRRPAPQRTKKERPNLKFYERKMFSRICFGLAMVPVVVFGVAFIFRYIRMVFFS